MAENTLRLFTTISPAERKRIRLERAGNNLAVATILSLADPLVEARPAQYIKQLKILELQPDGITPETAEAARDVLKELTSDECRISLFK